MKTFCLALFAAAEVPKKILFTVFRISCWSNVAGEKPAPQLLTLEIRETIYCIVSLSQSLLV
jgi:hypothetical protein